MNLFEAREECIEMWTWIRDHAGEQLVSGFETRASQLKKLYALKHDKAHEWLNLCSLCEVFFHKKCEGCPLSRGCKTGCENPEEAYFMWRHLPASDIKAQRVYAQQIIDDVTAWKPEAIS
jgi:hypothetical protein